MKLRLISKKCETNNIWSFKFLAAEDIDWTAGQSIRIEVPRRSWGYNERRFTIGSLHSDGYIQIYTRISDSEFKQDLQSLAPDSVLDAYGTEGGLNWGSPNREKILIAGGTGIILPYIAVREQLENGINHQITIIYSSHDSPPLLHDVLRDWAEQGIIDLHTSKNRLQTSDILEVLHKKSDYDIHISGPSSMYTDLKRDLALAGISNASLNANFLK